MNNRGIIVLAAAGLVGLGLGAVGTSVSLKSRIDNANADLLKAQAPIPHADLHARALEILRERTAAPVVAESVPLPKADPRKAGVQ